MDAKKKWAAPELYLLSTDDINSKTIAYHRESFWTRSAPAPGGQHFLYHGGSRITTIVQKSSFVS